jgi:hypothetical protein
VNHLVDEQQIAVRRREEARGFTEAAKRVPLGFTRDAREDVAHLGRMKT